MPRGAVAILWSFGICSMNVHHKEESVVAIRMSNIPFLVIDIVPNSICVCHVYVHQSFGNEPEKHVVA